MRKISHLSDASVSLADSAVATPDRAVASSNGPVSTTDFAITAGIFLARAADLPDSFGLIRKFHNSIFHLL